MCYFRGIYKVTLAVVKGETKQALFAVKGETKHQHETVEVEVLMPISATDILCAEHVPHVSGAVCLELTILSPLVE